MHLLLHVVNIIAVDDLAAQVARALSLVVVLSQNAILVPGPRFNIKMPSCQYRQSHCGDKTVVRLSYLHNGISYTSKMTPFYWIMTQGPVSI